jgi:hypothetical protein
MATTGNLILTPSSFAAIGEYLTNDSGRSVARNFIRLADEMLSKGRMSGG